MLDGLDFIINILFIIDNEMWLIVSKEYVCCLKYCEICIIVKFIILSKTFCILFVKVENIHSNMWKIGRGWLK